jgi:hypothetical protein
MPEPAGADRDLSNALLNIRMERLATFCEMELSASH